MEDIPAEYLDAHPEDLERLHLTPHPMLPELGHARNRVVALLLERLGPELDTAEPQCSQ
jgi:hypothetical protein